MFHYSTQSWLFITKLFLRLSYFSLHDFSAKVICKFNCRKRYEIIYFYLEKNKQILNIFYQIKGSRVQLWIRHSHICIEKPLKLLLQSLWQMKTENICEINTNLIWIMNYNDKFIWEEKTIIFIYTLLVWVSVCLFVIDKRENDWTQGKECKT